MEIGIIGDIMLGDQPVKTGFGLFPKFKCANILIRMVLQRLETKRDLRR